MKILNIITLGIFLLICSSCNLSKSVGSKEDSTSMKDNAKTTICSDYYLSNRTTDCNKSLKFMKSIIEPDTLNTSKFNGFISFSIRGETNPNKLEDLEKLFIDLDCLKNLDKFELFKLLCSEKAFRAIEEHFLAPENLGKRFIFECTITNMNCFTVIVNNDVVEKVNWCINRSSN